MPCFVVPDSIALRERNDCHDPRTGRFCRTAGAGTVRPATFRKAPGDLPEAPARYFDDIASATMVPLARLRIPADPRHSILNAEYRMWQAYTGHGARRKPLYVRRHRDGHYTVVDGKATAAIARKHHWKTLPALVEEDA